VALPRRRAGALVLAGLWLLGACSSTADSADAPSTRPSATRASTTTSTSSTTTTAATTTTMPAPKSWIEPATTLFPTTIAAAPSITIPPITGPIAAIDPPEPPPAETAPPLPPIQLTGPLDPAAAAAFNDVVARATTDRGDSAVGVAVVRNGEVLHAAGLGYENPWTATPATPSTRFRVASVSKVLTATVIMQLAYEGLVPLDSPFLAQLGRDAADPRMAAVTVRQLLSHTSGVGKLQGLFFDEGAADWRGAADRVLASSLAADPGTRYQYSNANFVLLGLLLEHVTGLPYDLAVVERLGNPIQAEGLRLGGTYDAPPGEALYAASPDRNFMEVLGPAGGWMATPTTIATLVDALDGNGLYGEWPLTAGFAEMMRAPQPLAAAGALWNYGHGLMLLADGSWGHTGTIEQAHSIVFHRPDDITVAIFVSGDIPSDTMRLAAIADEALRAAAP
jgi:D-alanyl-D-alanine carboxypeptidase